VLCLNLQFLAILDMLMIATGYAAEVAEESFQKWTMFALSSVSNSGLGKTIRPAGQARDLGVAVGRGLEVSSNTRESIADFGICLHVERACFRSLCRFCFPASSACL